MVSHISNMDCVQLGIVAPMVSLSVVKRQATSSLVQQWVASGQGNLAVEEVVVDIMAAVHHLVLYKV